MATLTLCLRWLTRSEHGGFGCQVEGGPRRRNRRISAGGIPASFGGRTTQGSSSLWSPAQGTAGHPTLFPSSGEATRLGGVLLVYWHG